MLERKSILDNIEITRSGAVQIRIGLLIVDGETEVSCKWHRFAMPAEGVPEDAIAQQMEAVNAHLVQMGEQPVDQSCIDKMKAAHDLAKLFVAQAKGE